MDLWPRRIDLVIEQLPCPNGKFVVDLEFSALLTRQQGVSAEALLLSLPSCKPCCCHA